MIITTPGIYDIPFDEYNADPCPTPSLRSSIAGTLLTKTPRHAMLQHPRLNPHYERVERGIFDLGTAAHELLLMGETAVVVVDANDWRTNAAKQQRDDAYNAGRTPILAKHWIDVEAMVDAAHEQLRQFDVDDVRFMAPGGRPEQTLIWQSGEIWIRTRPDWLPPEANESEVLYDYKTTSGSAHPDEWGRARAFSGPDLQAALNCRAAKAVLGWERPRCRFVVQENSPPYALSVVELTPAAMALADRKLESAIQLWARCLREDRWPGYPTQVCHLDAPGWMEMQWEDRVAREEGEARRDEDHFALLNNWQSPIRGEVL